MRCIPILSPYFRDNKLLGAKAFVTARKVLLLLFLLLSLHFVTLVP